ncbi:MAG: 16S rRNA (cytidine(1402)-2'-O)-methyltransferase [Thermomicrobiales bacterium]
MGELYVVATPIGNLQDMTPRAIDVLRRVSLIAAEDTRHSQRLLRAFDIETPLISYHQHNEQARVERLLTALESGDVALISDAGTPAISDPGAVLVCAVREAGYVVTPIPGVSAVIAAASASGLIEGPYLFQGFLPRSGEDRRAAMGRMLQANVPVVLFESPNRLGATLTHLADFFGDRQAVVARELTKLHEEIVGGTLGELAAIFSDRDVKGEVVIVVAEAASESETPTEQSDARQLAARLVADGLKPSRAARELAKITGLSGSEAYDLVRSVSASGAPGTSA